MWKNCFSVQNFTEIGQFAAELWPKKTIFIWHPSTILNFKNVYILAVIEFQMLCVSNFIKIG